MKKIKININEIFYILAFLIVCFLELASRSDLIFINDKFRDVLNLIAIILFLIKILKTKYTLKERIFFLLFGSICLYSYLKLKLSIFIFLALAICAVKDIDLKKVIIADIYFKGIFLIIHFIAFILNITGILNLNEITRYEAGILRHSIFLRTPHNFMAILFWFMIEIDYI